MKHLAALFLLAACSAPIVYGQADLAVPDITREQSYVTHRATSQELTGANADYKTVNPGETITLLDTDGPGMITHMWFTIASGEPYHLKRIVLRAYWDGEKDPSVEAPIGDFFGLGLGVYYNWQSTMLSVGSSKALNSFFPMPYRKHARITITNDGKEKVDSFYYSVDYRTDTKPLPADTLYFHAQYRQAQPNHGWTTQWYENGDPIVNYKRNLDGKDNYVWLEARGRGHYIGVTMSVFQNQDGWWGEGDDMFFIDQKDKPTIIGTGSEDYFLGAWDFGGSFSYMTYGAPQVDQELAGARSSVYRFHLDSPVTFKDYMKATIEHGHGNHRSDSFYSVAYWYQTEPHMAFPPLPPADERVPTLQIVGGPGNGSPTNPAPSLTPR